MTVNYYIKCPICGTITRMRTPAGYLYKQPVHVHCGKCKTLLTGEFICDNENIKAYFLPGNCKTINDDKPEYEYEGQTSGELLSYKIIPVKKGCRDIIPHTISPAMSVMMEIEHSYLEKYISFAKKIEKTNLIWQNERSLYDLFFNRNYSLIIKNYYDTAKKYGYNLSNDYDITRFVHFSWFNIIYGIFRPNTLNKILISANYEFAHLNRIAITEFYDYYTATNDLLQIEKKLFKTFDDFLKISLNIMPAISTQYYSKSFEEDNLRGLSTCTFDDIKNFYLDSYETLAELSILIKAFDNIKYRGSYKTVDSNMDFEDFKKLTKGNKIKILDKNEFFSKLFNLSDSANKLRNAIGHNNYEYNGFTQSIEYCPNIDKPDVKLSVSLLSVAISCIEQMKSTMVLVFFIFELMRTGESKKIDFLPIHPMFYKNIGSNNNCACGSGKKFKKCCRDYVEKNKKTFKPLGN